VDAIARLRERRPHAGVTVRTGDNPDLLAWLKSGETDVAVGRMAEPAMMQGVSFELLYAESLAVVTRPRHPLAAAGDRPLSLAALLGYPLVVPVAGTAPRHEVDGFFAGHGIALPPGRTETQSVTVARALTLVSDAVWITPRHPVQLDLDRRWLHHLNVPVPGSAEPVGILSRSGVPPSELAAQLIDALRERRLPRRPGPGVQVRVVPPGGLPPAHPPGIGCSVAAVRRLDEGWLVHGIPAAWPQWPARVRAHARHDDL
jgi:DNA-binding transcriptional LysR family regulator